MDFGTLSSRNKFILKSKLIVYPPPTLTYMVVSWRFRFPLQFVCVFMALCFWDFAPKRQIPLDLFLCSKISISMSPPELVNFVNKRQDRCRTCSVFFVVRAKILTLPCLLLERLSFPDTPVGRWPGKILLMFSKPRFWRLPMKIFHSVSKRQERRRTCSLLFVLIIKIRGLGSLSLECLSFSYTPVGR